MSNVCMAGVGATGGIGAEGDAVPKMSSAALYSALGERGLLLKTLKGHLNIPADTVENTNCDLIVASVGQVLQLGQCLPLAGIELAHN